MEDVKKLTKEFKNVTLNLKEEVSVKGFVPPEAKAKHEVLQSSMPEDRLNNAVTWAKEGFCLYKDPLGVASHLTEKLKEEYGGDWTCSIGESFQTYCTYKNNSYAAFKLADTKIAIFLPAK